MPKVMYTGVISYPEGTIMPLVQKVNQAVYIAACEARLAVGTTHVVSIENRQFIVEMTLLGVSQNNAYLCEVLRDGSGAMQLLQATSKSRMEQYQNCALANLAMVIVEVAIAEIEGKETNSI